MMTNDGVLALVLPKTVLSGISWEPTRSIFRKYNLCYVICSHESNNWNFSESTELSEVLLVLAKPNHQGDDRPIVFVNLSNQPRTNIEALSLARSIQQKTPAVLGSEAAGTCEIKNDGRKFGEMIGVNKEQLAAIPWSLPLSFSQTDLCRSAYYIWDNSILIPGIGIVGSIKTTRLSDVAHLGPDGRDGTYMMHSNQLSPKRFTRRSGDTTLKACGRSRKLLINT
jgi:hypothetical protein